MPNPEKKVELGKIEPEYRQDLEKGKTFKFSEEERKRKIKEGMTGEDIEGKEKDVIAKQELARQEAAEENETESGAEQERKKISFEKFKAQQEREFEETLKAAREKKDAAYGDKGEEKERMAA